MRDLPQSRDLLALARELLLDELAPLLPPDRQRDAHLIATVMAIAVREQEGDVAQQEIEGMLAAFYPEASLYPPHAGAARPSLSPQTGRGGPTAPALRERGEGWNEGQRLRRFAADLRKGALETSPSRQKAARAILWRLTIAKLREGNPRFLAANGIKAGRPGT